MGLETRKDFINDRQVLDRLVTKIASCTLNVRETLVHINSTSAVIAIAMAPPAEMAGKFVTLYVTAYTEAITVTAADSQDFAAPTFNGVDDGAVLYCDGIRWWTISART
jgi:hypothetical protein